jgi:hypothetical protein
VTKILVPEAPDSMFTTIVRSKPFAHASNTYSGNSGLAASTNHAAVISSGVIPITVDDRGVRAPENGFEKEPISNRCLRLLASGLLRSGPLHEAGVRCRDYIALLDTSTFGRLAFGGALPDFLNHRNLASAARHQDPCLRAFEQSKRNAAYCRIET